jgi:two-component system, LuxR family, sensor kinase FixL
VLRSELPTKDASIGGEPAASIAYYKKMYDRVSALGRIGVWECELPSEQLTWTETVYDLFEIPHGTPLDRDAIVAMYEPESRARLEQIRAEAIRHGTGFALDAKIRTGRGNLRWIRITADIEMEDGRPVRIFGTKQDITGERTIQDEVRSLQTELIHVSRVHAMTAMASTLAHELNQPLTAISNYLVAARRMAAKHPLSPDFSSCIEGAGSSAQRAGEIIRRLRHMTVNHEPRRERFSIKAAIDETVALATAGRPDLEIGCEVDPRTQLSGDRIQIQQVLLNLIQNSYEAANGSACRMRITVWSREEEIELCVADQGPGIDPDLLPDIFESLVTTKPEGMGIGLSVSRTIIERHSGRISAHNNPDGGASICFVLPIEAEEAE